ncbi:CheY-like chemotaxis protein [Duganella sp. 3397]|uniref:response regulator n=1 Tax=Duganella sp. 3397 TaxID=2817732 RepID=UPI002861E24C|nr:response regulator [Duganella sp. 3397]MDR7051137.1 CheY-like chemotaxis protein [Duganella sp. 3397]
MTVLVIDDDQINLDLFCLMLSMLDMATPVPLRHAQAALEWCTSNTPDLVVVDYLMPDIDGLAFLRRFRALPGMREVPVVMVTGATEVAIRHEALRLSANDFLTNRSTASSSMSGSVTCWRFSTLASNWRSVPRRSTSPCARPPPTSSPASTKRSTACRALPSSVMPTPAFTCRAWRPTRA